MEALAEKGAAYPADRPKWATADDQAAVLKRCLWPGRPDSGPDRRGDRQGQSQSTCRYSGGAERRTFERELIDAFQEWCSAEQRKKRIFRAAKGFVGGRRRLLKSAKETLLRAGMFAFRDRRARKREFRRLFIVRLSAAAEMRGLRYSRLIHGLRLAQIGLDRKSLSELAIHDARDVRRHRHQGPGRARPARRRGQRAPEGQDRLRLPCQSEFEKLE